MQKKVIFITYLMKRFPIEPPEMNKQEYKEFVATMIFYVILTLVTRDELRNFLLGADWEV